MNGFRLKLLLFTIVLFFSNTFSDSKKVVLLDYFKEICTEQKFSGTILVVENSKLFFKQSCGLANRSFNVQNNINTKFNLGSVGKLFTAVAIAQLIQQHKISFTTTLNQVLPGWVSDNMAKQISVGDLLIHASGLGDFMQDKRWQLGADSGLYIRISDYKPLIKDEKLLFKSGSSQSYSNSGYIILGAIIESVTHQKYTEYLQQHVFLPAGMFHTGIFPLDEPITNRAEGYTYNCSYNECKWKNNNYQAPFIGSPAGGAYSNVEDLFNFSQALHTYKLLNEDFTHKIFSVKPRFVSSDIKMKSIKIKKLGQKTAQENMSPYGFAGSWNQLGFAVWKNPDLVGHTGGIEGASAFFATSPDGKTTIIILSNMSGPGALQVYQKIRRVLGYSTSIINY